MNLLAAGLGLLLLAGCLAALLEGRPRLADGIFRWGAFGGCLVGLLAAGRVLLQTSGGAPTGGAIPGFELDGLSAWFTIVVLGPGAASALYGIPYLAHERPTRRSGTAHLLMAVLLTALTGVMTATTVVAFLAMFELMAVAAYLLVVFDHQREEVRRAGLLYIALTHVSILALLGMFAAWGGAVPGTSFTNLAARAADHRIPAGLVLGLSLIGFGIKAGVVPGHFWLPGAHAAAPSHVSALLSGVVLKSGIYGLCRVLVLFGAPPAWWAWTVLLLGSASAVLGVLWALAQHDLKRLLAYHSVENIGIILMGLGLGALGRIYHHPVLSLLGFSGALLHSLNHAVFKSLLFLSAGAIVRVTGTREIDRMGGLYRVLPRTAWAFLLGSLAIVGLPPLNGFVSEWIIFRGLLQAGTTAGVIRMASALVAGLALTGALALACFTKLHGVIFLGSARTDARADPTAEQGLVTPQWVLAAACVAIGLSPGLVVPVVLRAAGPLLDGPATSEDVTLAAGGASAISLVAVLLLALSGIVWLLRARRGGAVRQRVTVTWGCGFPAPTPRMQYTASGYASSILGMFGALSGSRRIAGPGSIEVHAADPVLDRIGRPVWDWVRDRAQGFRRIQTGRILWYLRYVIAVLFALLAYLWLGGAA